MEGERDGGRERDGERGGDLGREQGREKNAQFAPSLFYSIILVDQEPVNMKRLEP